MIAPKNPGPMEHKGVRLGIRLLTGAMPAAVFPDAVRRFAPAKVSGFVHAVKYYPAGATTHSENGVTDLARCRAVFAAIEKHALPLLMHGEVTDPIGLGHDPRRTSSSSSPASSAFRKSISVPIACFVRGTQARTAPEGDGDRVPRFARGHRMNAELSSTIRHDSPWHAHDPALVLIFVGGKMLIVDWFRLPVTVAPSVAAVIIATSAILSLATSQEKRQ